MYLKSVSALRCSIVFNWFYWFLSMDGVHPHRSAAARVGNYSDFDAFGFDRLLHLKDRYLAPKEGSSQVDTDMASRFAVAVQEGLAQWGGESNQ